MPGTKQDNWLFYLRKGHLIPDEWPEASVDAMSESYIKRLWGVADVTYEDHERFDKLWEEKSCSENTIGS